MLNCKQITALVTDYLEGRLSFGQRVRFWLHLGMCDGCRRYLRQMRAAVKLAGRLAPEPPPAEVRDALRRAFRNWEKPG